VKTCKKCGNPKDLAEFYHFVRRGRSYPRSYCKWCCDRTPWHKAKERLKRYRDRDRARGLVCTLKVPDVRRLFGQPCAYCADVGESLDRKDPRLGYTPENVVSCCRTCNHVKSNLPEMAWLHILPSYLEAKRLGLFTGHEGSLLPP
jgi:hypothetical protein